ncbi:hypothetical protein [Paenibacillus alvei]|uniref:Uncharacterized protein n=1 Tax=Paenibacillus alvei TaxID=44250 RepID=A0A383RHZ0_PAEAL|nr:hypothetical protein [Paenibacillus alvei]SYX85916.1 conserved protein of unknown function [Paenibacillus alvei]
MKYNNKFEDGETVIIKHTGERATVNEWSYTPLLKRYTYSLMEHQGTFFYESELENVGGTGDE